MNTTTLMVKAATSGLTGRREQDIKYLREQIEEYCFDERVAAVLKNVMRCLINPGENSAAA